MDILIIKKKIYKGYSSNALSKAIIIAIKLSNKEDLYKDDLHKEIKLIDNMTKEDWNSMSI